MQTPQRLGAFEVAWITQPELSAAREGCTTGGLYSTDMKSHRNTSDHGATGPKLIYSKLQQQRFPRPKEILDTIRGQIAALQDHPRAPVDRQVPGARSIDGYCNP